MRLGTPLAHGTLLLAEVARKVFCITPNTADPERLFSEFGRMVSKERSQQKVDLLQMRHVIAASVRQENLRQKPGGKRGREHKWFCDTAAAVLMLRQVEEGVGTLMEDVQSVVLEKDNLEFTLTLGRQKHNQIEGARSTSARPASGTAVSTSTPTDVGSSSELPVEHPDGSGLEDELDGIACLDDSELDAAGRASKNFDGFVNSLAEACKEFDDVDFGVGQVDFDCGEDARAKSLATYPLGELPRDDDPVLPKETMPGFRGETFPLVKLFGLDSATGRLPPLTKIGRVQRASDGG
jgi:hAT family C-terminal dimerisation region